MSDNEKDRIVPGDELFARVAAILEAARGNVVRAVNTNMVVAYWLIGREIVETVQQGDERAAYGAQILKGLSERLQAKYGRGFSVPNLENFRKFFIAYREREPISSLTGRKSLPSGQSPGKSYPVGRISLAAPSDKNLNPAGSPFAPELTWSHYRALMGVDDTHARDFYEREAIECGWSKVQLERQIQSSLYQRILANHGEAGLRDDSRERLPGEPLAPKDVLRSPLVLEFLQLPDTPSLHESALEQAIIDDLQGFMLELGKGFAFVARQKHIRFDDDDFYIDLVFYNYLLKCFLRPHPLFGQERIRRQVLCIERRKANLRHQISAAAPDRRRARPRTRKGAQPPRRKDRRGMTEVIGTAPSGEVRFFGGGAPDWDPARARGGESVDECGLHRGVDALVANLDAMRRERKAILKEAS